MRGGKNLIPSSPRQKKRALENDDNCGANFRQTTLGMVER